MLLYEYRIRDEFKRTSDYAESARGKFETEVAAEELLKEAENFEVFWNNLKTILPKEIQNTGSLERHLSWMKRRLRERSPIECRSDIEDICKHDIPAIETAFREWCKSKAHFDVELAEKTIDLIARHELDSAVRKAFVILTTRLASKFEIPDNIDGSELVNRIFGKTGKVALVLNENERQSMRDLLAGLYGLFRNKYAHRDEEITWYEVEAVLPMINFVLKEIDKIK